MNKPKIADTNNDHLLELTVPYARLVVAILVVTWAGGVCEVKAAATLGKSDAYFVQDGTNENTGKIEPASALPEVPSESGVLDIRLTVSDRLFLVPSPVDSGKTKNDASTNQKHENFPNPPASLRIKKRGADVTTSRQHTHKRNEAEGRTSKPVNKQSSPSRETAGENSISDADKRTSETKEQDAIKISNSNSTVLTLEQLNERNVLSGGGGGRGGGERGGASRDNTGSKVEPGEVVAITGKEDSLSDAMETEGNAGHKERADGKGSKRHGGGDGADIDPRKKTALFVVERQRDEVVVSNDGGGVYEIRDDNDVGDNDNDDDDDDEEELEFKRRRRAANIRPDQVGTTKIVHTNVGGSVHQTTGGSVGDSEEGERARVKGETRDQESGIKDGHHTSEGSDKDGNNDIKDVTNFSPKSGHENSGNADIDGNSNSNGSGGNNGGLGKGGDTNNNNNTAKNKNNTNNGDDNDNRNSNSDNNTDNDGVTNKGNTSKDSDIENDDNINTNSNNNTNNHNNNNTNNNNNSGRDDVSVDTTDGGSARDVKTHTKPSTDSTNNADSENPRDDVKRSASRDGNNNNNNNPKKKPSNHTLLEDADVVFIVKHRHTNKDSNPRPHHANTDRAIPPTGKDGKDFPRFPHKHSQTGSLSDAMLSGKSSRHVPGVGPPGMLGNGDGEKTNKEKDRKEEEERKKTGPLVERITPAPPPRPRHHHGPYPAVDLELKHHREVGRHGAAILCLLSLGIILFVVVVLAFTTARNEAEPTRNDSSTALYVNYPHY